MYGLGPGMLDNGIGGLALLWEDISQEQLGEGRVCLLHSLMLQPIVAGKSWQQTHEAVGSHESAARRPRDQCCCPACFSLFQNYHCVYACMEILLGM